MIELLLKALEEKIGLSPLLFLVLMIILCAKDIKLTKQHKVAIMYLVIYFLVLFGWIDNLWGITISILAIFVVNEIFTNDTRKIQLFNIWSKIVDFIYRAISEDMLFIELLAIIIVPNGMLLGKANAVILIEAAISCLLLLASVFCSLRNKFETKSVGDICGALGKIDINTSKYGVMCEKYGILLEMEDNTYKKRKHYSHNMLAISILKNIKRYVSVNNILHPVLSIKKVFSRGYGTIEMQIIRTIGMQRGYDRCIFRRKAFEVIYSDLIFNSIRSEYKVTNDWKEENFKNWILENYIRNVPIRLGEKVYWPNDEKSTSEQLFGKDFDSITNTQFFVWCMCLTFIADMGPKTIERRKKVINALGIDKKQVKNDLVRVYPQAKYYYWDDFLLETF